MAIGTTVTANTAATAAQATTIASYEKEVVYSVSDTAEAIAALGAPARNEAVNITASGTATADQATTIQVHRTLVHQRSARSRTAPRTLLAPPMTLWRSARPDRKHSSDGSSGQHHWRLCQGSRLQREHAAAAIAGASDAARNEAVNITASGTANVDQGQHQGASNTGTSTISAITDSAENLAGSTNAVVAIGTTVTANTAATAAQANTIGGWRSRIQRE